MERNRWAAAVRGLASAILISGTAQAASAGNLGWKFSSSLDYETGTYGTAVRSSSLYVPFTVKNYRGDGYTSVTLPFLSQSSNGQVRNVGGRPVRTGRGQGSTTTDTQSGLGDVVLRGGYALLKDDPQPLDLSLTGKIKLPTADKDKGLGTGEFDAGVGLEFGKLVAPGWTVLADVYFTKIGDPPGTDFNDQVAVDVGFARTLKKDLTLTVLLEGSNALVPGEPDPRDLSGTLDYRLDDRIGVYGGGLVGLSQGSPDFGVSFGGSYRF